uniref:Uncharacterized protein n=1 Tax=Raoultella ornithinolytica TaxID=54291 RepID=A0A2H4ZGR6_RAOOR|nr:Hypothetical protein [Raoultella ornithinolytica]
MSFLPLRPDHPRCVCFAALSTLCPSSDTPGISRQPVEQRAPEGIWQTLTGSPQNSEKIVR